MKVKRLGIRKVLAKVGETKLGKVVDTIVSTPVIKVEGVLNTIAEKSGLNKIKVDASGKRGRRNKNNSILAKIEQSEKNVVEQDAKDIVSAKSYEQEKIDNELEAPVSDIRIVVDSTPDSICAEIGETNVVDTPPLKAGERV